MFLNDHANLGFFSGWHCHILGFIYFAPFFITTGLNFGESLASHWGSALLEDEGWGAAWAVGKWWEGSLSNISWKTAQLAKMGHWKLEIGLSRYQPSAFQLQYPQRLESRWNRCLLLVWPLQFIQLALLELYKHSSAIYWYLCADSLKLYLQPEAWTAGCVSRGTKLVVPPTFHRTCRKKFGKLESFTFAYWIATDVQRTKYH